MNYKIISALSLILVVVSCHRLDRKKLEIIEGIQLGTSYKNYEKQLDSLGIKGQNFYTKSLFFDYKEIEHNQIFANVSDIFNFSEFKSSDENHRAILQPITLQGTRNVIGLRVLIGHTGHSGLVSANSLNDLTNENGISAFNQNISIKVFDKIRNMLTSKYGKPKSETPNSELNTFFVIEGEEIKKLRGHENRKGKKSEWETDLLKIELFEGLPSIDSKYSKDGYQIVVQAQGLNSVQGIETNKGESPCLTYVYIKYEVKNEIFQLLNLDQHKI